MAPFAVSTQNNLDPRRGVKPKLMKEVPPDSDSPPHPGVD